MQTKLNLHKVHYYGTWESPKLPEGRWYVEQKGKRFHCFHNNLMMESRESLSKAIQFCEDHYHKLLKEKFDAKIPNHTPQ